MCVCVYVHVYMYIHMCLFLMRTGWPLSHAELVRVRPLGRTPVSTVLLLRTLLTVSSHWVYGLQNPQVLHGLSKALEKSYK